MFRVPRDPHNPTLADSERIGFFRWLTSSKADRKEWARRRNAVLLAEHAKKMEHITEWGEEKKDAHRRRFGK